MNQEAGRTAREKSSSTSKAGILRLQAGEHVKVLEEFEQRIAAMEAELTVVRQEP